MQGHSKDFDDLVDQFSPNKSTLAPTVSPLQLRTWLSALSHVLSRLERHHAPLVEAIVRLPWSTMDAAFVKSYIIFVGMLISARPEYLSLVLSRIAMGFTYRELLPPQNIFTFPERVTCRIWSPRCYHPGRLQPLNERCDL